MLSIVTGKPALIFAGKLLSAGEAFEVVPLAVLPGACVTLAVDIWAVRSASSFRVPRILNERPIGGLASMNHDAPRLGINLEACDLQPRLDGRPDGAH